MEESLALTMSLYATIWASSPEALTSVKGGHLQQGVVWHRDLLTVGSRKDGLYRQSRPWGVACIATHISQCGLTTWLTDKPSSASCD